MKTKNKNKINTKPVEISHLFIKVGSKGQFEARETAFRANNFSVVTLQDHDSLLNPGKFCLIGILLLARVMKGFSKEEKRRRKKKN